MKTKTTPKITKATTKGDYTKITYYPDFKSFEMTDFDSNETALLIKKRAYDLSAATSKETSIWFNEQKVPIKDFTDYMTLFIGSNKKVVYKTEDGRWEIGFALCPYDQATQISFVNAICTEEGGSHVTHVLDPVLTKITEELQSKSKGVTIKKQYIKDNVIIFIKALIENPSFSSQLKRQLTSKVSEFGSRCNVPEDVIKKVAKLGITANVMDIAKAKEMKDAMRKIDGTKNVRLSDIKKLEDANWAGTAKSMECTLILTEGDSAKGLALNGITSAGGRNRWGVFPLRGKFLNIRSATAKQLVDNEEIKAINRIMGLKIGITDIKKLRYGRVMVMSDQDSVTGDTPLLLKDLNGQIIIKNIEDISDNFDNKEGLVKEYGTTNLETWTDKGWTKIKHVMRHKTSKKIYRVLTHTGCVDVTEDHSLLNELGEKIKPNECKIGQKLLHSFPVFEEHKIEMPEELESMNVRELYKYASKIKLQNYQTIKKDDLIKILNDYKIIPIFNLISIDNFGITPEEAYVLGLVFADGTCGIYNWHDNNRNYDRTSISWNITNTDLKLLEKAKDIMNSLYGNNFTISELKDSKLSTKTLYRLILNGGNKIKDIVERYRELLYYKNWKYISSYIKFK